MKLPESLTSVTESVRRIPLKLIRDSLINLRSEGEDEELSSLGDSLKEKGQLQAIVVHRSNDGETFDLIIGSRRLKGARKKGLSDILAFVIEKRSPVELLLMALAENLHRKDLNPFEESQGYLRLMKEYGMDIKAIAANVHKSENHVRHRIELLSMPEEIKKLVAEKKLSINLVGTLARVPSGADQVRHAKHALKHRLTRKELAMRISHENNEPKPIARTPYELTTEKVKAHVVEMIEWVQKVHRRMNLRRINAGEKASLVTRLEELEREIRILRASVSGEEKTMESFSLPTTNVGDAANHGQEWGSRDLNRITSSRRPSDEELSIELGRTVLAIKAMRAKSNEKKK